MATDKLTLAEAVEYCMMQAETADFAAEHEPPVATPAWRSRAVALREVCNILLRVDTGEAERLIDALQQEMHGGREVRYSSGIDGFVFSDSAGYFGERRVTTHTRDLRAALRELAKEAAGGEAP